MIYYDLLSWVWSCIVLTFRKFENYKISKNNEKNFRKTLLPTSDRHILTYVLPKHNLLCQTTYSINQLSPPPGLEPTTPGLPAQCLYRYATAAFLGIIVTKVFLILNLSSIV